MKNHTPPHTLAPPLAQPVFTPLLRWLVFSLLAMVAFTMQAGAAIATVEAPSTASISLTTATLGGELTNNNGSAVTERGVVYSSTEATPQIGVNGAIKVVSSSGTADTNEPFTSALVGLVAGTTYNFRAYAINGDGTAYSAVNSFTTLTSIATVNTPTSASISYTTATLGGTLVINNGSAVTERGVVYSATQAAPAINIGDAVKVVSSTGAVNSNQAFTSAAVGLAAGTTYKFRAYAINGVGTSYSAVGTFTTLGIITGVTATASSQYDADYPPSHLVNGDVPSANGLSTDPLSGAFGSLTATHDNNNNARGMWVAQNGSVAGQTITFALGGIYNLNAIHIWNLNQIADGGADNATTGGVNQFDILVSSDGGITYSEVTSNATLAKASNAGVPISAVSFALVQNTITHVRIRVDSNHGRTYVGLSEVMFYGTPYVAPTVTSPTSASVLTTSATLGGTVTAQGSNAIIQRGVVFADNTAGGVIPTIANQSQAAVGTGVGTPFTAGVTGILSGTDYAYRAFARTTGGYAYSEVGTFTTVDAAPDVYFVSPSLTPTSATLNARIHAGGRTITRRGFVYSSTVATGLRVGAANTTTVADVVDDGGGNGNFSVVKTGLAAGTTYNYVAYATNNLGTTYTSVSTFKTSGLPPTVTTPSKTSITGSTATLGGYVSKTNGSDILSRGVVYLAVNSPSDAAPTIEEIENEGDYAEAISDPSTGYFTVAVEGLTPATTYYFSAYAENDDANYGFSTVASFSTLTAAPSVTTGLAGTPNSTSVTVWSNEVEDANGAAITERGVVFAPSSVSTSPTLGLAGAKGFVHAVDAVGGYSINATSLLPFTQYSYRAYAINSRGTSYGTARIVTTAVGAPTVSTPVATNFAARTITLGGSVVKKNGADVTAYGVEVYQAGQWLKTVSVDGAKSGPFTVSVTGLSPATAYTFYAFATNSADTGYSAAGSFTTLKAVPTVDIISASGTTGIVRGSVEDNNGAAVTKHGVVYSLLDATPKMGEAGVFSKNVTGAPDGTFTVDLNLNGGETYYVRTYAYNSMGYGYSSISEIDTPPAAPSVNARAASSITATTATLGGKIVSDNGKPILERGIRYWKTATPNSKTTKIVTGTALGIYSTVVKNLTVATEYTFQAYAENSEGPTYSDTLTFTTLASSAGLLASKSAEVELGSAAYATETCYTLGSDGLKYLTIVISDAAQAPTVEVSGNLTDWFSGSSHTTVISDAGGVLKVRDNTPVTADSKRYIRVRP